MVGVGRYSECPQAHGADAAPQQLCRGVLVIGGAAGQVKATTSGSIYDGLLAARRAAEAIGQAFAKGCGGATTLQGYERVWRSLLDDEHALELSSCSYGTGSATATWRGSDVTSPTMGSKT